MITVGDTVVSEHLALQDHQDGDVTFKLLDFEQNWSKRKWKEKIAINKLGQSHRSTAQTLDHALLTSQQQHGVHPIAQATPIYKLRKEGEHHPKHVIDDK